MQKSPALLSDIDSNEDASVYQISPDLALVQTLDFITPVVDSAYHFGAIAAANALSDVFAMGGVVLNALNIVAFDKCHFGLDILGEILAGANDKVRECNALVVGGHTIESEELFFGLSVTGKVHPKAFVANNTARAGDAIILTKPLGVGILSTALKAQMLDKSYLKAMLESMMELNFKASQIALNFHPSAMSDVTGFGLLGHLKEMLNESISFEIFTDQLPFLQGAKEYFNMGLIPAGAYKNYDFIKPFCKKLKEEHLMLCDPQTSGGLLISISEKESLECLKKLEDENIQAKIIAKVINKQENDIIIS